MSWSPEDRLLLACCAADEKAADTGGVDWDAFLAKAGSEGAAQLAWRRLSSAADPVPQRVLDRLAGYYYATAAGNTIIFMELARVLAAFNEAGLAVMVLKGAVLAEKVYANPGLRAMQDVDLLIKKDDLWRCAALMREAGYSSSALEAPGTGGTPDNYLTSVVFRTRAPRSVCFHVHWHLVNSTVPNDSLIRDFRMNEIWSAAGSAKIAGVETMIPAPRHLLIHLAEHALRVTHSLSRLGLLADIGWTVRCYGDGIGWQRLMRDCRGFNIDRLVYYPLALAARWLAAPVPEDVLAGLRPERPRLGERLFMKLALDNCRMPGLSYLLYLSRQRGPAAKARFLLATVLPPRPVMARRSATAADKVGVSFYLRRLLNVLGAAARAGAGIVRGH